MRLVQLNEECIFVSNHHAEIRSSLNSLAVVAMLVLEEKFLEKQIMRAQVCNDVDLCKDLEEKLSIHQKRLNAARMKAAEAVDFTLTALNCEQGDLAYKK